MSQLDQLFNEKAEGVFKKEQLGGTLLNKRNRAQKQLEEHGFSFEA